MWSFKWKLPRSCGAVYYAVQGGSNFESGDEILKCDIQMKATEQYFPVVLFIMLHKIVLIFKFILTTEQYFPMVLFTVLYRVVLTFESVDEILKCDHSNESY